MTWLLSRADGGSDFGVTVGSTLYGVTITGMGFTGATSVTFTPGAATQSLFFHVAPLAREIWIMDGQGTNAEKLTAATPDQWFNSIRWSPDGRRLAYVRVRRIADQFVDSIETRGLRESVEAVIAPGSRDRWIQDFVWLADGRVVYSQEQSSRPDDARLEAEQGRHPIEHIPQ